LLGFLPPEEGDEAGAFEAMATRVGGLRRVLFVWNAGGMDLE